MDAGETAVPGGGSQSDSNGVTFTFGGQVGGVDAELEGEAGTGTGTVGVWTGWGGTGMRGHGAPSALSIYGSSFLCIVLFSAIDEI